MNKSLHLYFLHPRLSAFIRVSNSSSRLLGASFVP
jgi:hypothetical protein